MGAGKTKMITPLVILRYLQILNNTENLVNTIYLVLPNILVKQSYDTLKNLLELNYNIDINNEVFIKYAIEIGMQYDINNLNDSLKKHINCLTNDQKTTPGLSTIDKIMIDKIKQKNIRLRQKKEILSKSKKI